MSLLGKTCSKATARFDQCAGGVAELSKAASVDVALASSSSLSLHPKQTRLEQILGTLFGGQRNKKGGCPLLMQGDPRIVRGLPVNLLPVAAVLLFTGP